MFCAKGCLVLEVYTPTTVSFFEWETKKNYDFFQEGALSKPHLMRFLFKPWSVARLKGTLNSICGISITVRYLGYVKTPRKFHRTSLPLKILTKMAPPKKIERHIVFPSSWAFRGDVFCCETLGFVVSCLHSWAPTWTKTPSDYAKKNFFFPQRLAGLIFGEFSVGELGWLTSP